MIDYDPHKWRAHFFDVRGSMVRVIGYRLIPCLVVAAGVTYAHHRHVDVGISDKAHGLIGVALGLLLVFRTNASYDRFWEGRKQWGGMVNETRNLARNAVVLTGKDPALAGRIVRWTIAFAWSSMFHLRGQKNLGPGRDLLPVADARRVEAAGHLPLHAAREITSAIAEAKEASLLGEVQQMMLDQNVQLLIDYIGACERIRKTPLPFAYVVHLRRALVLYCLTLPFALLPSFGYATIAATAIVAYILLGIEEIGVEIEDPFGTDDNDLPLDDICRTIDGNLRSLLPAGQTFTD
ncbi:MAG: bestrophin family ion channel [Byssovorax sp.]